MIDDGGSNGGERWGGVRGAEPATGVNDIAAAAVGVGGGRRVGGGGIEKEEKAVEEFEFAPTSDVVAIVIVCGSGGGTALSDDDVVVTTAVFDVVAAVCNASVTAAMMDGVTTGSVGGEWEREGEVKGKAATRLCGPLVPAEVGESIGFLKPCCAWG